MEDHLVPANIIFEIRCLCISPLGKKAIIIGGGRNGSCQIPPDHDAHIPTVRKPPPTGRRRGIVKPPPMILRCAANVTCVIATVAKSIRTMSVSRVARERVVIHASAGHSGAEEQHRHRAHGPYGDRRG